MFKLNLTLGFLVCVLFSNAQWIQSGFLNEKLETAPEIQRLTTTAQLRLRGEQPLFSMQTDSSIEGNFYNPFLSIYLSASSRTINYTFGSYTSASQFTEKIAFTGVKQEGAINSPAETTNVLTLTTDGKVGLGTADPTKTLDVNGESIFRNKVGIGTETTGAHMLAVEGSIGAREINVETTAWSDFVFAKDYKLNSLEEVKSFIEQNNHLPDVPSEDEVLKNGINVSEMNATLLQKIEELTLYVIDINEEVKALKSENSALKAHTATK